MRSHPGRALRYLGYESESKATYLPRRDLQSGKLSCCVLIECALALKQGSTVQSMRNSEHGCAPSDAVGTDVWPHDSSATHPHATSTLVQKFARAQQTCNPKGASSSSRSCTIPCFHDLVWMTMFLLHRGRGNSTVFPARIPSPPSNQFCVGCCSQHMFEIDKDLPKTRKQSRPPCSLLASRTGRGQTLHTRRRTHFCQSCLPYVPSCVCTHTHVYMLKYKQYVYVYIIYI